MGFFFELQWPPNSTPGRVVRFTLYTDKITADEVDSVSQPNPNDHAQPKASSNQQKQYVSYRPSDPWLIHTPTPLHEVNKRHQATHILNDHQIRFGPLFTFTDCFQIGFGH